MTRRVAIPAQRGHVPVKKHKHVPKGPKVYDEVRARGERPLTDHVATGRAERRRTEREAAHAGRN